MALLENSTGQFIAPEKWGTDLIIGPVKTTSMAALSATTSSRSGRLLHIPRVTDDPSAAWVAEGEKIATSEPGLAEIVVAPCKVAGVVPVSNEMIADSDPAAIDLVGRGLARDIARKVDAAFFGALSAPAPSGLGALAGVTEVDGGSVLSNIDPFLEAATAAASRGTEVTAFVANPADVLALSRIRKAKDSNESLLDTVAPGEVAGVVRTVAGVPLYSSADVAPGVVWGIPKERTHLGVWKNVELSTDSSFWFDSDMTAVRAIMRVAFAFPDPAAIVKITVGGE